MNGVGRLIKDGYDLIGIFKADHFVAEADLETQRISPNLKNYLYEKVWFNACLIFYHFLKLNKFIEMHSSMSELEKNFQTHHTFKRNSRYYDANLRLSQEKFGELRRRRPVSQLE